MKTEYKYISYREDKDLYTVAIRINGKLISKTFKTMKEALIARTEILRVHHLTARLGVSHCGASDAPTFNDGYLAFVKDAKTDVVTPATLSRYYTTGKMFQRYIGAMKIDTISRNMWQDIFTARQSEGNLSYHYMEDDYHHIRDMYRYYMDRNVLKENPLDKPLVLRHTKKDHRRPFTDAERTAFLQAAKRYDYEWFFLFAMYFMTGCRRGELLALQWQDVDFEEHCIHIRHGIAYGVVDGIRQEIFSQPKTKASIRSIPISDKAYFVLRVWYLKKKPAGDAFVFQTKTPSLHPWISLTEVAYAFRYVRKMAGIDERLTLHCIRHTVASKLVTAGIDLATIQRIGGWSSPNTLLRIYAHSNDVAVKAAMRKAIF